MRLGDALRGMPERGLTPYRLALAAPRASIADLLARLTDPERVRAQVDALDPEALLALRILWFNQSAQMQTWQFQTLFNQAGGGAAAKAVEALVERALLLPPLSAGGLYAIPAEIHPVLDELAQRRWLPDSGFLPPPGETPTEVQGVDVPDLLADFVRFLGALRASIRVRRNDGLPYQADQQRLAHALAPSTLAALPPTVPTLRTWEGYEPTIAPLLVLALVLRLLEPGPEGWRAGHRAEEWVRLAPGEQWYALLSFWAGLCRPHMGDPLLGAVYGALTPDRWCRPTVLAAWLGRFSGEAAARVAYVHNVIVCLGVRLGALDWAPAGAAPEGAAPPPISVRLRPEAAATLRGLEARLPALAEPPLVQGTFDVLAGPRTPAETLWLLEGWAERQAVDRFTTYRLTRASVARAARAGLNAEHLLSALERSPGGVPQNVAFSVREWAGGVVRLQAELGMLLRCADERMAEAALRTGALRGCERLAPTLWLVPADRAAAVARQLGEAGCEIEGDLRDIQERLSSRFRTGAHEPLPSIKVHWPGAPPMDTVLARWTAPPPRPEAEAEPAAAAAEVEALAGPEPAEALPAPAVRPPTSSVRPAPAAREPLRPPTPRRVQPRSLGDALPAVLRLPRAEVLRVLQRGLQASRPVGVLDRAGARHVLLVRELTDTQVSGECLTCATEHRLHLEEINATVRV